MDQAQRTETEAPRHCARGSQAKTAATTTKDGDEHDKINSGVKAFFFFAFSFNSQSN